MKITEIKSFADLKYWFLNVYWYHYRWHTIAVAFALTLVIGTIVSVSSKVEPDYVFFLSSEYAFDFNASEDLERQLTQVIDDRNGDGVAELEYYALFMDDTTQMGVGNRMLQSVQFSRDEVLLVVVDERDVILQEAEGLFLPLDQIGFPGQSTIDMMEMPKIKALGFSGECRLKAGIIGRSKADPQQVAMAYTMLAYLIS